jgi:hypothetical protein
MTEHTVLAGLSETLQGVFEAAITNDPAPGLNAMLVDLRSAREMRLDNEALGLSVWLYRVDTAAQPRGMLPTRAPRGDGEGLGLTLEAHYLLTPMGETPGDEQKMLGRVLEVLRDHPVLSGGDLRGALAAGKHEVRLTIETLTLAESAQLWLAMQEPYRLAVACLARVIPTEGN